LLHKLIILSNISHFTVFCAYLTRYSTYLLFIYIMQQSAASVSHGSALT